MPLKSGPLISCFAALALFVCGGGLFSSIGNAPADRLRPDDLKVDLAILRRALEELHPGLYRYNTVEQMAEHFATLETAFARNLTRAGTFLALSEFTAKIKCGHTFPNPTNQSKTVATELFAGQDKVPFHFRWLQGRMFITRNLTDDARLSAGTEVLEINGTPAPVILKRLMTIARADGANDAKRVSLLEVQGHDRFETFDVYLPLFFPPTATDYRLQILLPVGERVELTVPALTSEQRTASQGRRVEIPQDDDVAVWSLDLLDEHTACLTMATWAVYNSRWDWVRFLNESFDTLVDRGIDNLVIDLRGNEGGSSVGNVILARLLDKEIPLSDYRRFVRYRVTPADLNPFLDTWDDSFRDWGESAVGPTDGLYRLTKFDDDPNGGDVIRPVGRRFAGRVYVLVDASNSSATFEFALAIREHKLGVLVGQPTGGNQRGINGGAFFFLRLPKSGIEVDLPLIAQFPTPGTGEREDAGLIPGVVVTPTVEHIAGATDAQMETVMRLIAGER